MPRMVDRASNIGVQDAVNLGWKLAQVVNRTSPESLLDTYHAERHPVAARVLRTTMAHVALRRPDERTEALRDTIAELLSADEPRRRFAAMMSGLDIHYDLGEGHPLLGRRMPDLDLVTANGPLRVFTLLHDARPVLLNLGEPGGLDITPWADRVQLIDAKYVGTWELPALGAVTAPTAVLIRPDGYVAWVGDRTQPGAPDALTTWFGPPTAVAHSVRASAKPTDSNRRLLLSWREAGAPVGSGQHVTSVSPHAWVRGRCTMRVTLAWVRSVQVAGARPEDLDDAMVEEE